MDITHYSEKVQSFINLIRADDGRNMKFTVSICNELIEYAEIHEDAVLLGFAYYNMGKSCYINNAQGEDYILYFEKAIFNLNKTDEYTMLSQSYIALGIIYSNKENMIIAIDYFNQALECCKTGNLGALMSIVNINLGVLYYSCHRYEEAKEYIEKALDYEHDQSDVRTYNLYRTTTYINYCRCLLQEKKYDSVKDVLDTIHRKHWFGITDRVKCSVWCVEAGYYNEIGDYQMRDEIIGKVHQFINHNMPIMDTFEEYAEYCELLISANKKEEFEYVVGIIEPLVISTGSNMLILKIISLKMQFCKKYEDDYNYYRLAGEYYKYSQLKEQDTLGMINNMLDMRKRLEKAND